jgi:IS30 family transposase
MEKGQQWIDCYLAYGECESAWQAGAEEAWEGMVGKYMPQDCTSLPYL